MKQFYSKNGMPENEGKMENKEQPQNVEKPEQLILWKTRKSQKMREKQKTRERQKILYEVLEEKEEKPKEEGKPVTQGKLESQRKKETQLLNQGLQESMPFWGCCTRKAKRKTDKGLAQCLKKHKEAIHLSSQEMIREFDEMARVEGEMKKTRQKLVGGQGVLCRYTKVYRTPSTQGVQGNSGVAIRPHKGALKTFLLCSAPGRHLPVPGL